MISVDEALDSIFSLLVPLDAETVSIRDAAGRVLTAPVTARRSQPPFDTSSMDGYAVSELVSSGERLKVIGEARAGARFDGSIDRGQAVRIFTGAPIPDGTRRVVIQEDVTRNGAVITVGSDLDQGPHIRQAGQDFAAGDAHYPRLPLRPVDIALLAAMGYEEIRASRRPVVALIATGDELEMPGQDLGPDQIVASNALGLAALIQAAGGEARVIPIARDAIDSLDTAFRLAQDADLIVTIGGASVGDHDLVAEAARRRGMEPSFHRVAMRPGKPLMAGRLAGVPMIGLPGNPVSSIVCGYVFLLPALRAMLGLGASPAPRLSASLAHAIGPNGSREHYMRASVDGGHLNVADRQDSSLLSILAGSNALAIRPPQDPARPAGDFLHYILM